MISKVCCSFPGWSAESRGFNMANSTMIIAATSNCMVTKLAHGRDSGAMPTIPVSELPTPARLSLKSLVIHSSVSCIRQFEQDFDYDRRNRHKQARKCGRQADCRVFQYNIETTTQKYKAHAQE